MTQKLAIGPTRKLPGLSCRRGGLYFFNTTPLFGNLNRGVLARSNGQLLSHVGYTHVDSKVEADPYRDPLEGEVILDEADRSWVRGAHKIK